MEPCKKEFTRNKCKKSAYKELVKIFRQVFTSIKCFYIHTNQNSSKYETREFQIQVLEYIKFESGASFSNNFIALSAT